MSYGPSGSNRGAGNPGSQPVTFTLGDAKRIGDAVRQVETGRRSRTGSSLPRAVAAGGVVVAKFTGGWLKGSLKTVVFAADTNVTASATNVLASVSPHTAGAERFCIVASSEYPSGSPTYVLLGAECAR